jgi:flagellin-specific chaperone FliS
LKLRDWNRAQEVVREWDVEGKKPKRKHRATIEEWRDQFLQEAKATHLTEATLRLYKLLFKQLIEFALERGIKCADELDLKVLTEFRIGWKIGPCRHRRGWSGCAAYTSSRCNERWWRRTLL